MKKVEILLATYNTEKYIHALLESLLAQTFTDWRLLIHDDGSSDKTLEILREYRSNYPEKIFLLEDNIRLGGSLKNFSHLAEYSKSNYVMFCDQDDVWLPDKIALTFEGMMAAERAYGGKTPLLIHTDLRVVGDSLKTLGDSFWKYQNLNPEISRRFSRLLVQNVVTGCTVMVNRPLLELALPIPEGAVMHDWWLALVASAFGKIEYISSPTVLYRQHKYNSVGAKKWGIEYILAELLLSFNKDSALNIRKTIQQAQEFQTRYSNNLDAGKRKILQTFTGVLSRNWLARRILLIKYGIIKSDVIRNLGFLTRI
ncbi:MAG: glycosyltransferase family 2 protein [Elusimicrobia bacterium]|nr:glycosyltransferase family 2 protein [Elusimicrobiota bacterium]